MSESKKTIVSVSVAFFLVGAAYTYRLGIHSLREGQSPYLSQVSGELKREPLLGKEGSAHAHATLVLTIRGEIYNFAQRKYMLRNPLVHFENSDGIVVHAHAKGVTLPYFFSTLGMSLDRRCLKLDTGKGYCTSGNERLSVLVNRTRLEDPRRYEFREGDRVLVTYGNEDDFELKFKANGIPPVPENLGLEG